MENKDNYYVAIMAGGVGSRFWPASRESMPKQFLDILGIGKSLIRMTFERFNTFIPADRILVVTNKMYKDLVHEQLPEMPITNILTEPSRNNTGPCVAYTAFRLEAMNPSATFVIAPSDHVILKEPAFLASIKTALEFASKEEVIVTLGIEPTRPDTGYGYIEAPGDASTDAFKAVNRFREKPDLATAQEYLAQGGYYWNAGIFVWSCKTILNSFKKNAPDIHSILSQNKAQYNTPSEQQYIDEVYPTTPGISVDYAILENADNVYTLPADIGWSDLGTWNALHAYSEKDDNGSVVQGLEDYIIIDEDDVLLVYPKSQEQEIKSLRNKITQKEYL